MADLVFTDKNFGSEVLQTDDVALVDFWAPWCGPCKIMGPVVEEVAKEFVGKAKVGKLNVDENTQIAGKYNVMSIPTLIIFKKGQPVKSMVGVQSKETLSRALETALAN